MENRVVGPSIALIVTAILGGLWQLLSLVLSILGTGLVGLMSAMPEMAEATQAIPGVAMLQGAFSVVSGIIGLAFAVFILYGAFKMKNLESYTISMIAVIIAMIPCFSPCCFLGLPFGIWALVVLLDKDVKACFKS